MSSGISLLTKNINVVSVANSIIITAYNHGLSTGNIVIYTSGLNTIGGLVSGYSYFARKETNTSISLFPSLNDASNNTNRITLENSTVASLGYFLASNFSSIKTTLDAKVQEHLNQPNLIDQSSVVKSRMQYLKAQIYDYITRNEYYILKMIKNHSDEVVFQTDIPAGDFWAVHEVERRGVEQQILDETGMRIHISHNNDCVYMRFIMVPLSWTPPVGLYP